MYGKTLLFLCLSYNYLTFVNGCAANLQHLPQYFKTHEWQNRQRQFLRGAASYSCQQELANNAHSYNGICHSGSQETFVLRWFCGRKCFQSCGQKLQKVSCKAGASYTGLEPEKIKIKCVCHSSGGGGYGHKRRRFFGHKRTRRSGYSSTQYQTSSSCSRASLDYSWYQIEQEYLGICINTYSNDYGGYPIQPVVGTFKPSGGYGSSQSHSGYGSGSSSSYGSGGSKSYSSGGGTSYGSGGSGNYGGSSNKISGVYDSKTVRHSGYGHKPSPIPYGPPPAPNPYKTQPKPYSQPAPQPYQSPKSTYGKTQPQPYGAVSGSFGKSYSNRRFWS